MNTTTQSPHLSRVTAAVLFSALALSFAAMSQAGAPADAVQSTVRYVDLDASRPGGAAALYARISAAANDVCRTMDGRDLASKNRFNRCVHKAVVEAVAKVDQPALYSVYYAKNPAPRPVMLAAGQAR
jgi:UrcA family protein